jgi:hypothetical protein
MRTVVIGPGASDPKASTSAPEDAENARVPVGARRRSNFGWRHVENLTFCAKPVVVCLIALVVCLIAGRSLLKD